jgi:hypothetical protein
VVVEHFRGVLKHLVKDGKGGLEVLMVLMVFIIFLKTIKTSKPPFLTPTLPLPTLTLLSWLGVGLGSVA